MTEADLLRKLSAIETLIARAATSGERTAAVLAQKRLQSRLGGLEERCEDHYFTIPDVWSRRLLMALARKMGFEPFRYRGLRRTTVVIHGKKQIVHGVLWAKFLEVDTILRGFLEQVTDRVIHDAIGSPETDLVERV